MDMSYGPKRKQQTTAAVFKGWTKPGMKVGRLPRATRISNGRAVMVEQVEKIADLMTIVSPAETCTGIIGSGQPPTPALGCVAAPHNFSYCIGAPYGTIKGNAVVGLSESIRRAIIVAPCSEPQEKISSESAQTMRNFPQNSLSSPFRMRNRARFMQR